MLDNQLWRTIHQFYFETSPSNFVGFSGEVFQSYANANDLLNSPFQIGLIKSSQVFEYKNEEYIHEQTSIESIHLVYKRDASQAQLNVLRNYWPLFACKNINDAKPITLLHMATTLDGKIATAQGDSKWIGNEENLIHAHRVRALVDGVLVGGNTIRTDLPKLSVRRVRGTNPTRLFLTNTFNEWESLPEVENAKTILIREQGKLNGQTDYQNIDDILKYEGLDDKTKIIDILKQLKNKGVHSILIEGGPTTTGSFVQAGVVNWIQIHIAPLLFGSGKSSMSLPEIEKVDEAYHLQNVFYTTVSNAMMMTGELKKK